MYLYNCYSKNSNSAYNLKTENDTTIYVSNTQYDTSNGNIVEL